jgi:signal transduction histidine kinase
MLAVLLIGSSAVLGLASRSHSRADLKRDARTRADDIASRLSGGVDGALARITLVLRTTGPVDTVAITGLMSGVANVTADPAGTLTITSSAGDAPTLTPAMLALMGSVRDTGEAGVDSDLVAVARYEGQPHGTLDRRATVRGYVIGKLDARRAVIGTAATQINARGTTWRTGRRRSGQPDAIAQVAAGKDRWTLEVWLPTRSLPMEALLAPAFGIAISLIIVFLTLNGLRRRRVELALSAVDTEALRIVTETAAVLQDGLDLGTILPAVVVTLVDELGLDGAGVLESDDRGRLSELFTMGGRATIPRTTAQLPPTPDRMPGGELSIVPLQRAGRITGALWLRPRRDVPLAMVTAVRGVAELLQAAITNLRVFETQSENVRRLEELDRLKTAFIGTVSHELRTPATAIVGFGSMLEANWEKLTDEQRRDFARRATRNAKSLGVLIEDLLDFARLERGTAGLRLQPVNLSQLVLSLLDRLGGVFDTHRVVPEIAPDVVVPLDPTAVERIVTNLLSNASKYSPAGSTIDVVLAISHTEATLTVDDAGPGIPLDERARIFSPFYRMETDEVRRTRGAGIGLAVVKELADALNATIHVGESPLGGARFTITFPLVAADPSAQTHPPPAQGVHHVHAS